MIKKLNLEYDWKTFLGAITFDKIIPLPSRWTQLFQQLARWSPLLEILLGGGLGLADMGLNFVVFPLVIRSALIVAV